MAGAIYVGPRGPLSKTEDSDSHDSDIDIGSLLEIDSTKKKGWNDKQKLIKICQEEVGTISSGKRPLNIAIIGSHGCGKSSLLNTIFASFSDKKWKEIAEHGSYGGLGKQVSQELISETWLQENNFINIEGFEKISRLCRNENIGTRNEGGLAVYCKQHLCKEIIESIVLDYSEKGIALICGDFNSRIGEVSDILYNDQLNKFVTSVNHFDNPIISDRCSMDKVVNTFGRKLFQVCYNTGLPIANGILGGDTNGKFTFCNSKGTIVNDYLLVSLNNYGIISDFEVLEMN
ncbi:unnamed protein product [Mytilus coruscus]|uniref:Endonuclease/exonuclease/phosphatase domain-containing protein n=1 Tax=Mytilus coruscus TaxID=42192 RepID=A0A6J8E6T1_MYTCO|nr:unnamed protein product [Mytilus coruscus]